MTRIKQMFERKLQLSKKGKRRRVVPNNSITKYIHDTRQQWVVAPLIVLLIQQLLGILILVKAQLGVDTCACSPSSYQFTFNLSNTCAGNNIIGNGVEKTECSIAPFETVGTNTTGNTTIDLVPLSVVSIDIIELDSSLIPITEKSKFGTFSTGDTFEYTSVTANASTGVFNVSMVPKALQISMLGNNANGIAIFFQSLILYVIDCSVFPTIETGSSIGWITLTKTTDPSASICPLVNSNGTTTAPAPGPTGSITTSPTSVSGSYIPTPSASVGTASPENPVTMVPGPVPTESTNAPQAPATTMPGSTKSPSAGRSTKRPSVSGSTKTPSISRSTKTPSVSGPTKTPSSYDLTKSPTHSSSEPTKLSTFPPSPLCPSSNGNGKGGKKGKGKSKGKDTGKGKGKGGYTLGGTWSDTLFEDIPQWDDCASSKWKKSKIPKGKGKSEKSKDKSKKKDDGKGKGKGKGSTDDWTDDYYGDDSIGSPTYAPRAVPVGKVPVGKVTSKPIIKATLSPTAVPVDDSSGDGEGNSTLAPSVANTTTFNASSSSYSSQSDGSNYDSAISYEEKNGSTSGRTKNFITIGGTVVGASICMFALVILGKQKYMHHRKIHTEKALSIMKGLNSPSKPFISNNRHNR